MDTARFDYHLPPECIAQHPTERRDQSRLMVIDRATRTVHHTHFRDLPQHLPPGTVLFRNNARVLPARLRGHRPTGGAVECLLLRPGETPDRYWALVKPGRHLRPGDTFTLRSGHTATVEAIEPTSAERLLRFTLHPYHHVAELAAELGELPLPPYIARLTPEPADRERYQTIYAAPGLGTAAAAPTAGLHFTPELLAQLNQLGIPAHDLTLHVGLDTFRPIQTDTVEAHAIHRETYTIPTATRQALHQTLNAGGTPLAVGTTALRSLEHYARHTDLQHHPQAPWTAEADLYLYPPATFHATRALLTNFHLPRSTLLCLVSAFLTPGQTHGIDWLHQLYAEAIAHRYRFFSYGDAMLIR